MAASGINTARVDDERRRASQSKDEFLAMLGHELRNPLAPITTTLSLIKLKGSGNLEREHAVIERQVEHLSRLVDDLLDISRITSGKVELRADEFCLRTALIEAVESASPVMEAKKHRVNFSFEQLDARIVGDAQRMRQVFVNLLVNAAKYTDSGGEITIAAQQSVRSVSISIRDTGIGMDSVLLPQVFDLFAQGKASLDRSQGGLGIGLAIVKELVSLHGGRVDAESAGIRQGSTFTVTLPRTQVVGVHNTPAPLDRVIDSPSRGTRVLLVDDNKDALDTLSEMLLLSGFEVAKVPDAAQALRPAPSFDPDACVLDIGLPGMDGYQLAQEFRVMFRDRLRRIRLIALTGYGQQTDKVRTAAAGFDEHLVKPVAMDALLAALQQA